MPRSRVAGAVSEGRNLGVSQSTQSSDNCWDHSVSEVSNVEEKQTNLKQITLFLSFFLKEPWKSRKYIKTQTAAIQG